MIEQLIACVLGVAAGYTVGLLPGIGVTVMMILLFSSLLKVPVLLLLIFYTCMVSACQFGGSVTALAVGLPGEANSFPLLKIRRHIIDNNQQSAALFLCASGHLLGSVITFLFSFLVIDLIATNTAYLKSSVLIGFGLTGIVMCVVFSESRIWFVLPSIVLAWVLSRVGINYHTGEEFMTFDNQWLSGGLPLIAVVMGAYAIPNIIASIGLSVNPTVDITASVGNKLILMRDNLGAISRGSVLGFFAGLIPYVGVDLSSYVAYYTERLLKRDWLSQVAAAETATNAAGIAMLLPLLIYGIAIQPSENLLLEITNSTVYVLNWTTVKPLFETIAAWLIVGNLLSFLLSWNLASPIIRNLNRLGKTVPWLLGVICVYSVYSIGVSSGQGLYYLLVLSVFTSLGIVFRKQDLLPFIFIFMLQDKLEPAIMRLWILYN